jgi:hypothetical protein
LRRVHRSFFQQLRYAAVFQCKDCGVEEYAPRPYRFHFGPYARCPRCGTLRVVKRRERDRIDKMRWGFMTPFDALLGGGKLYHCHLCRIQFYDRRDLSAEGSVGA